MSFTSSMQIASHLNKYLKDEEKTPLNEYFYENAT